jgi:hypothetical protein
MGIDEIIGDKREEVLRIARSMACTPSASSALSRAERRVPTAMWIF